MLEDKINQYLIDQKYNGSILIAKGSNIIISKGYGMADFELSVPNSPKTKFRIASITKIITAVAIMQLLEKKQLKLEDCISKYIKDYPNGNQITIHHLLSNTSGVSNFDLDADFYNAQHAEIFNDELMCLFKNKPLLFKPGEMFSYSISGYFLLGYIIEKITKQPYDIYLKKHIFEPLYMKDSGFDYYKAIIKNRAKPYGMENNQIRNADFIDMRVAGAGGGLYSTVEDLYLFYKGLMNNQIMNQDSFKLLWSNQIKINQETHYGYGIFLAKGIIGDRKRRKNYHSGGGPGVRSIFAYYPDDQLFCVEISNINDSTAFNTMHSHIEGIIFS